MATAEQDTRERWLDWKSVYFVGNDLPSYQDIFKIDWDFSHLKQALDEGTLKEGNVYLFGCTEPQLIALDPSDPRSETVTPIPIIVAVSSTYPLPDQIAINGVTRNEEVIPMSRMKMAWVPCVTSEKAVERAKHRVFILQCTQRRAASRQLKEERLRSFEYCLPYIWKPESNADDENSSNISVVVDIQGKPEAIEFDYSMDDMDEFIEEFVEERELKGAEDEVRKILTEEVQKSKLARKEMREAKRLKIEKMPAAEKEALKSMRTYKFYPANKTPDFERYKTSYINRYYGRADEQR
eukprot:TRINITY_DN6065_c0_g1_i1.p1 TRINITY_DN6065_c0_g1~~TRINITY_DN6065_c0_g1_i1.p1  ORF type:complete len:296 (-),score=68.74 TRINITY_DN6065_c0_g1_i1:656-1543(-)